MMDLADYLMIDEDILDSSEHDESERQRRESQSSEAAEQAPKAKASAGRIIRRRARKACVECHKRKVRCDVLTRGQVCTNCRLDGQPCIIRSNDGRRKQATINRQETQHATEIPSQDSVKSSFPAGIISVPGNRSDDQATFHTPPAPWQFPSATKPEQSSVSTNHFDMIFSYYGFLEADTLSHIAPDDFKFLEHKGCFHIPLRPILDDFVREYFLHVHPGLPLTDEREFWELYLGDEQVIRKPKKLSLFLFRAMMFASCSFVSTETVKKMGFQDAVEARTCFYRRAKLLFDFNATSDNISMSQGALLLTYYSSDREGLANTGWLRTAIHFATMENVHLYYQDSNLTAHERNTRKRLWWCCILRDRVLPLGVRRSIQITHEHFDFSQQPLVEDDLAGEFNYSPVYDYETKRALALIILAETDLAIVLTDVLSLLYPIKQLDYSTLMEMPTLLQSCKEGLHSWNSQLQESSALFGSANDSVTLFHGLLQIYYHSALAAMCQTAALSLQANKQSESAPQTKELGSELHSAIAQISKVVGRFVEIDVARYLPVSMVAYMALPIILNSIDLQGTTSTTFRNESKRRQLRLYNEAMETCQARYTGARSCAIIINKTIATAREGMFPLANVAKLQEVTSTALLRTAANKVDDWLGVFVSQPLQYLKIAMTIDISLCKGRYAETDDFPRLLLTDTTPSIPRGIDIGPSLVELDGLEAEPQPVDEVVGLDNRRIDLDFLDFGTGGKSPRLDVSSLNSPTIETILGDVLQTAW